jgi:putative CocE/NonD family hydrolase
VLAISARARRALLATALLTAGLLAAAPGPASAMTKTADVTIPASDGVNLVGDVYRPADGAGRYPAVIDMEPYGRSLSTDYVPEGYARVNTDVRGSGKSGGALCLLCLREQQDVYEVVEWVARQPWSNGHVALYGYSYSAITSLLGAALQPPHLDAVVAGHPPTDPYRDVVWHNGLYDQAFIAGWFAGQTAAQAIGLGAQPQYLDRAQQQFAVETAQIPYDGPVYQERSVLAKMSHIRVPVYAWSGFHDMFSRGDLRLIDGLASRDKLLVIDASTHHGTGHAGEVGAPYDDGSPPSFSSAPPTGEDVAWLERFLKGKRNGIEHKPRVRFMDLGDRTWHAAPSWAAVTNHLTSLYLSGEKSGTATLSPNDGTLASGVPTGRASYQDSYAYSPTAGASVPSGKEGPDAFAPYVPLDQTIDQPEGLTFTTPALTQPLRLAGPSELRFWAVTEASDMAWVGRLIDVAPDGSQSIITQGWLRASFRYVDPARSRDGAPYLTDDRNTPVGIGEDTEYRMDVWDAAHTLAPGHRLRLWFSSDSPNHQPLLVAGRNLILHDAAHPSRLLLGTRAATSPTVNPWAAAAISRLRVRPSAFRAARADASVAAGRGRRGTGTTISYIDSQAVTTSFTVRKPQAGVKDKRRGCVASSRRTARVKRSRRCTRNVLVGSFTHADRAGTNRFHFTGRVRGKALKPGRYRLDAIPRSSGSKGGTSSARFRIIR